MMSIIHCLSYRNYYHIAVYSGSFEHVKNSVDAFMRIKIPKPETINFYDVRFYLLSVMVYILWSNR